MKTRINFAYYFCYAIGKSTSVGIKPWTCTFPTSSYSLFKGCKFLAGYSRNDFNYPLNVEFKIPMNSHSSSKWLILIHAWIFQHIFTIGSLSAWWMSQNHRSSSQFFPITSLQKTHYPRRVDLSQNYFYGLMHLCFDRLLASGCFLGIFSHLRVRVILSHRKHLDSTSPTLTYLQSLTTQPQVISVLPQMRSIKCIPSQIFPFIGTRPDVSLITNLP